MTYHNNGKYKQISKLGSGSQGDVYLCEENNDSKIKFIVNF